MTPEQLRANVLEELPQESMMVFEDGVARPFNDQEMEAIGASVIVLENHAESSILQGYDFHSDLTIHFGFKSS